MLKKVEIYNKDIPDNIKDINGLVIAKARPGKQGSLKDRTDH